MDHIETLEEICSTTRSNGVPADFLRCKLFAFSLGDKAMRWLKSLPPGSITTWEQCRAMFLDKFHTQDDEHILNIFYDGANWNVKNSLNAASNGDFMTRTQEEAYPLIENLATSSSNQNEEYDRSRKGGNSEIKKLEEMSANIDMLMQRDQRVNKGLNQNYPQQSGRHQQQFQPQTYRPNQRAQGYQNQNYGQNRPFGQSLGQNRYQNSNYNQGGFQQKQPFGSFQPKNPTQFQTGESSVPAAKESKLESMLQQLMLNQQKTASEINTKVDNINVKVDTMYHDMNNKWECLSAHVKKLVTQVTQTAETVRRPTGILHGRGEHNPKNDYVNAITLRSGNELVLKEKRSMPADENKTAPMLLKWCLL
ncbi:PREDICTED: uncharacterized protein LOC106320378 [Brassica oleracea var. oleracea]|uniref:uncharacterized protein LOC106320378 n=1 Tax=Brassica oleracea var. oleracea TaxID=109376 RepID=UPI0006A75810|nr:PREDICTED: uncharacterized protein LOC106320378 [Brassica oleracea var. oleracea]